MIRKYLSRDFFERGEQVMADLYVEHREISMHTHEFWELSYIYSGKGKHHFGDKSIDIREGDIVFVSTDSAHCITSPPSEKGDWVCACNLLMTEEYAHDLIKHFCSLSEFKDTAFYALLEKGEPFCIQVNDNSEAAKNLFMTAVNEHRHKSKGSQLIMDSTALNIFIYLARLYEESATGAKKDTIKNEVINDVLKYISSNYGKNITLDYLAAMVHMAPAYLSRYFKKHTGKTLSEFLTQTRVGHVEDEAVTSDSINILWNRASLVFAGDIKEYRVYNGDDLIGTTTTLGYTVNGLAPNTDYIFKIEAVKEDGTIARTVQIDGRTKAAPTQVINVLDYGAKGNGLVTDTYAIQKAINDCPAGGEVWLPGDGHIYISGSLFLKSDMTFRVDGIILGSTDPKDYPRMVTRWEGWRKVEQTEDEWANSGKDIGALAANHYQHASLVTAGVYDEGENSAVSPCNVRNLTICGEGQINGNGFTLAIMEGPNAPSAMTPQIKDQSWRGRTLHLQNVQNAYVKDVTIAYSPAWTFHTIYCDNLTVDGANVISYGRGDVGSGTTLGYEGHIRNGDGIDPDSCTHVNIFNSYFQTGDDIVTLKSGRNKEGNDLDKPNAYIRVTDCRAERSIGGFGSGSETAAGSHDILFQNLYVPENNQYGFWLKTNKYRGGLTENIQARDIECGDGEKSGGARAAVRVDYNYNENKPAQQINPADKNKTTVRYLDFENVGGYAHADGSYSLVGQNGYKISHVNIRNPYICGNLSNTLNYCSDIKIWDIVPNVTWTKYQSSDVVINTDAVPRRERPDGIELVFDDFATKTNGNTWGFVTNGTGMDDASVDTTTQSMLLTNGNSPSGTSPNTHAYQLKTFDDYVKNAEKLHIVFKYR